MVLVIYDHFSGSSAFVERELPSITDPGIPEPPEGFRLMTGRGPFSTRNGLFYVKRIEGGVAQAFFAGPEQCNGRGRVHGGMFAAFLDGLLAHAAHHGSTDAMVTVQMSINYLAGAQQGVWVIGEAVLTRRTRELAFVEAVLRAEGRDLVRASGVFKTVRPEPEASETRPPG
jgi:acyl-coenzyme A thioesterase PaaI-like protein